MRVLAVECCPVCGATGGEDHALGEARLRTCAACGTTYATRRAASEDVYADGYYTADGRFGMDVTHPRFQAYLDEVARRRVARVPGTGRWLDVGCGTGELLAAAQEAGWVVAGVEPAAESAAIATARGLDVRADELEASGIEPGWDVVSAVHVLEHVPDVVAFLRTAARWLRPGGRLLVESPNWDARLRAATGAGWPDLRPLEHVTHFTPGTLRAALGRAGLAVVAEGTDGHRSPAQTLDEACTSIGRPGLARRLAPLCRERDAGGVRALAPGRVLRTALGALAAVDERRGRGRTVWAVGRA